MIGLNILRDQGEGPRTPPQLRHGAPDYITPHLKIREVGPLDHEIETVAHCITDCKFIKHAFSVISEFFHVDIASLFKTDTHATLTTPHGVLAWSAVDVNWPIRSAVKKQQATAPPWTSFLSKWCSYLAKWATATHHFISTDQPTMFCHTLEVYVDKSYIPPITLS